MALSGNNHTLELENLLLERESKLVALQLEDTAEAGVAAEEDGHLKKKELKKERKK